MSSEWHGGHENLKAGEKASFAVGAAGGSLALVKIVVALWSGVLL